MSRTKANFAYAVLSVALVLFLLGFFAMALLSARKIVTLFRERVDVWLELRDDAPKNADLAVARQLEGQNFVRPGSVERISRAESAAEMERELGDSSMLADLPAMMRDVVKFNVREEWMSPDSLAALRAVLKRDSMVSDVFYEKTETSTAARNIEKLGWLTLALGILFIFVAATLIHNTIRLMLYSDRFLIKNQELVGATWPFIAAPYLRRSVWNGLFAAIIAIAALLGLRSAALQQMPQLEALENWPMTLALFAALIGLGIAISTLSARWTVRKFLGARLDDLY